jgi:hypothetical protein
VLDAVAGALDVRRPRLWEAIAAPPWIGRGRAHVVVVNVLLPFALAAGLADVTTLFERLPAEPANRVTRYMTGQLATQGTRFRGACQRQGLLHLFTTTCSSRRCAVCAARA